VRHRRDLKLERASTEARVAHLQHQLATVEGGDEEIAVLMAGELDRLTMDPDRAAATSWASSTSNAGAMTA
jgi:hypothetical protein